MQSTPVNSQGMPFRLLLYLFWLHHAVHVILNFSKKEKGKREKTMTYYDKSSKVGYDERDRELNKELEDLLLRTPPEQQRKLMHRVHDGILQRMKEESTRKCFEFIKRFELCMQTRTSILDQTDCKPHAQALNECAHDINSEENYQRWRISFYRGELQQLYHERTREKVETLKKMVPDSSLSFKDDYSAKYAKSMTDLGVEPLANLLRDDVKDEVFDDEL